MSKLFHEGMTPSEARRVLFTVVEGKSGEELDKIKQEYSAIIPILVKKELRKNDGYLTSDTL